MTSSGSHPFSSACHNKDNPLSFLDQLVAASAAVLDLLKEKTQAHYLADRALQEKVEDQLRLMCRALFSLEASTPGWASHLSYRPRIAAFYTYLVGDPAVLKHDFVYDVVRGQMTLLHTEAVQLHHAIVTNTLGLA